MAKGKAKDGGKKGAQAEAKGKAPKADAAKVAPKAARKRTEEEESQMSLIGEEPEAEQDPPEQDEALEAEEAEANELDAADGDEDPPEAAQVSAEDGDGDGEADPETEAAPEPPKAADRIVRLMNTEDGCFKVLAGGDTVPLTDAEWQDALGEAFRRSDA